MPVRRNDTNAGLADAVARAAVVATVIGVTVLLFRSDLVDPIQLKGYVLSFGPYAPLFWTLLYAAAVFIPYATSILTFVAGLAFGPLYGTILVYLITIPACLLPFAASRRIGREWVEAVIGNTRVKNHADRINENAFLVFLYLRLLPTLPYEVQNYVAGVSRISRRDFVLATAIGDIPILFAMVNFGSSLSALDTPQFWIAAGLYLVVVGFPTLIAVRVKRARDRERSEGEALAQDDAEETVAGAHPRS